MSDKYGHHYPDFPGADHACRTCGWEPVEGMRQYLEIHGADAACAAGMKGTFTCGRLLKDPPLFVDGELLVLRAMRLAKAEPGIMNEATRTLLAQSIAAFVAETTASLRAQIAALGEERDLESDEAGKKIEALESDLRRVVARVEAAEALAGRLREALGDSACALGVAARNLVEAAQIIKDEGNGDWQIVDATAGQALLSAESARKALVKGGEGGVNP